MITIPTNFQTAIDDGEVSKIIFVKMWYNTETDWYGFSSKSIDIDGQLSFGAMVDYSPSKATWNLLTDNNITITTPALRIANIQTPTYSFIDDLVSKNFLGRKCQIFLGYEAYSTTSSDMVQVFDGTIDDIEFEIENNELSVVLAGHKVPDTEIQGRKVDYRTQLIGDEYCSSLSSLDSAQSTYLPICYGRHEFAPGVAIGSNLLMDYSGGAWQTSPWTYVYGDETKLATGLTYDSWQRQRWYTWFDYVTPMTYVYNDDNFTPITRPAFNYRTGSYYRWTSERDSASGWFQVWFNMGQMVPSEEESDIPPTDTFLNALPWRPSTYDYSSSFETSDASGYLSSSGYDGGWTSDGDEYKLAFDGDESTYWRFETNTNNQTSSYYKISLNTDGFDFWRNYTTEFIDSDWAAVMDQPIHVGNISGDDGGKEGIMTKDGSDVTKQYYEFLLSNHGIASLQTDDDDVHSVYWNYFTPEGRLYQFSNEVLGAEGKGAAESFPVSDYNGSVTFGSRSETWMSNPDWWVHDAWGISKESWTNFQPQLYFWPQSVTYFQYLQHIGFASRSYEIFDYDNMYHAMQSPLAAAGSMLSTPAGSAYQVRRPYQYIESILRGVLGATDDDFTDNWDYTTMNTTWTNIFSTHRDYSGFVIKEKTKLNDWLKKYVNKEPWSVYKNEYGKWEFLMLKPTYSSSDYVVDFGDCSSFSVKYSSIDDVTWKVNNLKTNYIHGLDDYEQQYQWENVDASYDKNFYGSDDERYTEDVIEKPYSSYSYPFKVNYSGTTYTPKKPWNIGIDFFGNPIGSNAERYWITNSSVDTTYPDFDATVSYEQFRSEQWSYSNWILSQWGNRHRVVSFRTKNPDAYSLQLGDVVEFDNVPYSCLGLEFKGWNGATDSYVTWNGQRIYPYFIVSSITKYQGYVEVEVIGLHRLNEFDTQWSQSNVDRSSTNSVARVKKPRTNTTSIKTSTKRKLV